MTNQEYVKKRNKLIPQAEALADRLVPAARRNLAYHEEVSRWNLVFHQEMNRLARDYFVQKVN
jgi:hypothetical protein